MNFREASAFPPRTPRLALLLGLALFGCGSKGAVSLSARVDNATVSVQPLALGTQLSGEFDLVLELGPAAPDSTSVTLGRFSLKGEQSTVVPLTAFVGEPFPVDVAAGQTKSVGFVLDDTKLIDAALGEALCGGNVWYTGTVTDTLSDGKPTVASSGMLTPSCE